MCVPSGLSSLERLEIPESTRENALWLIRVSRVGRLGAESIFVILSKLSVRMGCPWSETQVAIMDANVLPCS